MAAMPHKLTRAKQFVLWAVTAAFAFGPLRLDALTRSDLLGDPNMSPERFAGLFSDFKWDVHPFDIQNPDQFLETQTGDCIDYAVLADYVLKRKGFKTRLIRIEMVGKNMGHAVCYVMERRAYLDYNNRAYFFKLQRSDPRIREVATKVAESFDANWTFAQEFTFEGYKTYRIHATATVVKTDPPDSDPDRSSY
jgi:hypothetical protein